MSEKSDRDTEAYLARIRRTIAESNRLVEAANLRIAETDRMLESQGLTRAQVMGFQFTPEQRDMVNRELVRQGMEPLEEEETQRVDSYLRDSVPLREENNELAERQRKFGMMMKPFQI